MSKAIFQKFHKFWSIKKYVDTTNYFRNSELFLCLNDKIPTDDFFMVLEIGTFEGVFACYAAEHFAQEVHTVDPYDTQDRGTTVKNETESNFHKNLSRLDCREKIFTYKMTSDEFFIQNSHVFDLIYVDGSHEPANAVRDLENSLICLKIGGVMWIDDFGSDYKTLNLEIRKWLDANSNSIQVIHMNYQVGLIRVR